MRIPIGPTADAFTECNEKGKSGSSVYNALNTAVERLLKSADVDNSRVFGIIAATEYGSSDIFVYAERVIMDKGLKGFRAQLASRMILCEPAVRRLSQEILRGESYSCWPGKWIHFCS